MDQHIKTGDAGAGLFHGKRILKIGREDAGGRKVRGECGQHSGIPPSKQYVVGGSQFVGDGAPDAPGCTGDKGDGKSGHAATITIRRQHLPYRILRPEAGLP